MTYPTSRFLVRHADEVGAFRYPGLFDYCAELLPCRNSFASSGWSVLLKIEPPAPFMLQWHINC
jgi:hypothetical protein